MPRTELIPVVSADGQTIILQAIPLTPRERARRIAEKLRPRRSRARK
jgi:hypothetical protein